MNNALVWRPRITLADATQRRLWENLRDLRDVSEETSLINLQEDVSKICKSAFFEMSLRRCMRRLKDASEMHPCPLGKRFGHCKQEKHQIFVQQKTIFLNFHKTKDYFFWLDNKNKRPLRTTYLFLRNSRSMPPEVFFKKDKHLFRGTLLGDCFWNIWKCFPLLLCYLTIFPEAVPQRNSRSSLLDVFCEHLLRSEHLLRRTHLGDCLWNSWNSSPLFSVCSVLLFPTFLADIFQVLFTYCVITVFATHFDFGEFIVYFCFLCTFPILVFLQCKCDTDFCH